MTLATALMAWLPERSQAPLGWFYVAAAAALVTVLMTTARHASRVDVAA
jgi:DHA1 family bicyclomycin/chloramphenicol resistance-like MFS transporter